MENLPDDASRNAIGMFELILRSVSREPGRQENENAPESVVVMDDENQEK